MVSVKTESFTTLSVMVPSGNESFTVTSVTVVPVMVTSEVSLTDEWLSLLSKSKCARDVVLWGQSLSLHPCHKYPDAVRNNRMIIGKVINWGFSEVLARHVGRENDISQEITPMVSLLDKDIYNIWINKKAYTIKIWLNEGEQLEDNDILNIRENGNIEKVFSGCEREADIFVTNQ